MNNGILKKQINSVLSGCLCILLFGCGSGEDDPIVADRDLPAVEGSGLAAGEPTTKDERANLRYARMALDCINKQYPNNISHVLNSAEDVRSPRDLYPAFYGCYDWHSAVHAHWMLTRLWGQGDVPELDAEIEAVLSRSFTLKNIDIERRYFMGADRDSFERPYGMAWFLQLKQEMRDIGALGGRKGARADEFSSALAPLETTIVEELKDWIMKLAYPIRSGTHSQTAFAFGLMIDWANNGGDDGLGRLVTTKAREFYAGDKNCPLGYEPSGEDFLSPCLMEADLMRRIMDPADFARWLRDFLPNLPENGNSNWIDVAVVRDPSDEKLVHLDGLNLSRAWALQGIAGGLPVDDPRREGLLVAAEKHREVGLESVNSKFYAGTHWLASFATYLGSKRGIAPKLQRESNENGMASDSDAPTKAPVE